MPLAKLQTCHSFILRGNESQELWNWLLQRQGLSDGTRLGSVETIAYAALGLHSARLPSPYSTLAARSNGPDVALSLFETQTRRRVMTVRCMRKTLHTLPLALAAAAHVATVHFRERDALRGIVNAGEKLTRIGKVTDELTSLLEASGPLFHRDIEARLARSGVATVTARLALKIAWERGTIAYLNETSGWNREVRKFALTSQAYPDLDLGMSREAATISLMDAYFDRYGRPRSAMRCGGPGSRAVSFNGPSPTLDESWWPCRRHGAAIPIICINSDLKSTSLLRQKSEVPA